MALRTLLVPGTGGCTYTNAAGALVGGLLELKLDTPQDGHPFLCQHDDNPDEIEPIAGGDGGLSATGSQTAVYSAFLGRPGWKTFDYDWRLDIRYNGLRLAQHLNSAGDKWHLVCHSQGGLVVLEAARLLGASTMQARVDAIVFVGVPFFGTFNAVNGLLSGAGWGTMPAEVVRSWPSIYQMLPAWPVAGQNLRLQGPWVAAGLLPPLGQPTEPARHVSRAGLQRASAWHKLKGAQLQALARVRHVRLVHGADRDTSFDYPKFPRGHDEIKVPGDSAVPAQKTFDLLPDWMRQPPAQGGVDYRPLAQCAEHMLLCNDEHAVVPWCLPS